MTKREAASHILAGAAALWSVGFCAFAMFSTSPLERAMTASICGDTANPATMLGQCPACLAGAAALLLAAAIVYLLPSSARRHA